MSSSPVFVLVHGAWHHPSCWNKVTQLLSNDGFSCVTPALPSVGDSPAGIGLEADVSAVRSAVEDLVNAGKTVVVVPHSYGGLPVTQALEGLDKKTREAKGLNGGVGRLVYIMAMMVPEGFQFSPSGTTENMWSQMDADLDKGIVTVSPKSAKALFYQEMEDDEAENLGKELRPMSLQPYWEKTTFAAWRHIPTTYVTCLKDAPTTVAVAQFGLQTCQASEPQMIDQTISREVGHSPFLTQPEWTAEVLKEAAGKA